MIQFDVTQFPRTVDVPRFLFISESSIQKTLVMTNYQNVWYHILSVEVLIACAYAHPFRFIPGLARAAAVVSCATDHAG